PADDLAERARQLYFEEGPEPALPEFERLLELCRESGDRLGEAKTLGYLGNCYQDLGEFDLALDYLNRALEMKRELGARLEEGKTLSHIGLAYWAMGEYPHSPHQSHLIAG
ncbi:MAG: tetratricopeptide repeat protein, partial [Anaerolineae bacterium]|nr:tetratricopeptide repeat protein [Anaerolineae bacterium]